MSWSLFDATGINMGFALLALFLAPVFTAIGQVLLHKGKNTKLSEVFSPQGRIHLASGLLFALAIMMNLFAAQFIPYQLLVGMTGMNFVGVYILDVFLNDKKRSCKKEMGLIFIFAGITCLSLVT